VVLPKGQGDSLGEGFFEGAVRIEVIEQAGTMGLPILFVFKLGDDGGDGEDTVLNGVETDGRLRGLCSGSRLSDL
jgi:hypothetical protein